jgi:hypothetical protein
MERLHVFLLAQSELVNLPRSRLKLSPSIALCPWIRVVERRRSDDMIPIVSVEALYTGPCVPAPVGKARRGARGAARGVEH